MDKKKTYFQAKSDHFGQNRTTKKYPGNFKNPCFISAISDTVKVAVAIAPTKNKIYITLFNTCNSKLTITEFLFRKISFIRTVKRQNFNFEIVLTYTLDPKPEQVWEKLPSFLIDKFSKAPLL